MAHLLGLAAADEANGVARRPPRKLTPKQRDFARRYVACHDASRAAREAGYSPKSVGVMGSDLVRNPLVAAEIARLQAKLNARLDLTAERVLAELSRIALSDVAEAFDEDGNLRDVHEMPEGVRRCISGLDVEELFTGRGDSREQVGRLKKLRLWDKVKALEALGRHFRLFTERVEVTGDAALMAAIRQGRSRARIG